VKPYYLPPPPDAPEWVLRSLVLIVMILAPWIALYEAVRWAMRRK
jgi:hypothetical protein